jgi:putative transposase
MGWFSVNERKTIMKKTHHMTEQIIRILREAETSGQSHEAICREHSISPQTFYRWKSKYGGLGLPEVQRLRELERENTNLKGLLADQLLKNQALEIALEKNA